ncbi:hypothetical protein V7147_23130, partial [Bacillus sp. JJ1521]
MEDIKSIRVVQGKHQVEVINNPTSYPLIGKGNQGAVFRISSDKCVKIYGKPERARKEGDVLKVAQESPIIPRLYEVGPNFIIMEYFEGPTLFQYLQSKGFISDNMTKEILFMLKEIKRLKFTRLDARMSHIIVTRQNGGKKLKVIDHYNSCTKIRSRPKELFNDLKRLGMLPSFLKKLKNIDPESYAEWKD